MAASLPSKSGTRSLNANAFVAAAAAASSSPSHTSPLCDHFEGQVFRKNRCKKCLRDKSEHPSEKPLETLIPPVTAISSQSSASSPYKGNIPSQSPNKGISADQSHQKGGFTNQSSSKGAVIDQPLHKGNFTNDSPSKGNITAQSPNKGNITDKLHQKGGLTNQSSSKGAVIDQSLQKGNFTNDSPSKGNITAQSPNKGKITDQSHQKGDLTNQSPVKGIIDQSGHKGIVTQSPSSSPYKANVKETPAPSPYRPHPDSSNGILKTSQNGTVTPAKPPAMSSSRLRPIAVETGDSSPSGSHEQLNTTTQTIILSKHSPQIRRASSGENSRVLHGMRRFGSAEKVNEEDEGNLEMRTPLSGSLVSMVTAVESASDLMSMHTAVSAGSQNSLNSVGTYTSSRENFLDTVEEMQATIRSLTEQLDDKTIALQELESLNSDLRDQLASPLQSGTNAQGGTLTRKRDEQKRLRELEREKSELLASSQTLQDDLDRIREAMDEVNDPDEASASLVERVRDAAHKLQSAEMMCEDLMDDNEELKKELRSLESEMDELHDNFRQDQAVEFQTIQKEMEQTMKNCRILQFKLRKAERKCDELEADKAIYEVKLRQLTNVTPVAVAPGGGNEAYAQEMANELRQVMEVNKRLQEEIERVDEKRSQLKTDYDVLMKSAVQMDKQKDAYRSQTEPEVVPPQSSVGPVHVQISNAGAAYSIGSASGAGQEYDVNQLLRDLYDSVERETDLRDQLAFAEDQARRLRSQVTDAEHENDSLQHQLRKMSAARPLSGDHSKTATPEQLDIMQINEDMKVQLDVAEHEISALKRKLQEADHRNEELGGEVKRLKVSYDELKTAKDTMAAILDDPRHPPTSGSVSGASASDQRIRLVEAEATELRKKLVDKERQLERLSSQIDQVKRRSTLDRSRSLDDAQLIDLRRQLTTAEQEIIVLRQKAHALESDNDKLSAENKRLQFRTGGRRSTEEMDKPGMVKISEEFAEKYLADIAALSAAGKTAKELMEEMGELRQRLDESQAVIATAKDSYERILAKAPIKKDIATRQELKARIDELEADMKFALTVAEQEGTAAKRLQTEVEELRAKMRRAAVQDAPISDEVKAYRIKLYDTEHEVEALKLEIKDLQGSLVEERRRARSSETDIIAKERMDTQLRNLKQELAKQRYMVEELTSKDNTLSKQLNEWQKKYHSLKDAYKSDTDAWQKELTDLEQELGKEKNLRAGDSGSAKSMEKEIQQLKNKNASYEDQIRNLIEVGKLREKELREKNAKLDADMAKEKKAAEEMRVQLENRQVETGMQEAKLQAERERLEQKVNSLTKELEETTVQSKKEADKLRTDLEKLKKATLETDKALQEAKSEADKLRQERAGDGAQKAGYARLSAYERARAADQIKEEVEKLHKQNLELQKQLLDAKRASEEANEQLARSERKWGCERDETQRKLRQDEKIHKAEMSAVSMRFENKHKLLEDEMKTSNVTVKQLKKERDTLQERLDQLLSEMQRLREEHADSSSKLETANTQLFSIKSNRENAQHQLDEAQGRLNKLEVERNDAKSKAAKEKSSYELKIAELQDKLSQYEGQHAKLSAYALKTRQMAQSSGTGKKTNGDAAEVTDMKERAEAAEKAVRRAEKDVTDMKAHVLAVKLDKERENELLRAKIRELQAKHNPIKDAHTSLKLAYDSLRTELEVIQIERDDFAERLAENESYQIKERGKIDQILSEIQKLKDVAPSLLSSDEDLFVSSPSVPKRPSRGRMRDGTVDDKASGLSVPAASTDHKKYKGTKSADLQKAIDNITKVSEDIKAERKTRRPLLPHKRSQSASIAESSAGSSPLIRRYPSLDDDETGDAMSLPTPTPLKSIAKLTHRNPRFPSIPPSFIVSPPTAGQLAKHRARHDAATGSPITEESFTNPGGSWDSIDSDMSSESWNMPAARAAAHDDRLSYISLPNLPQKVDTATSMEDKPKRSLLDVAKAKRKKLMAKLRPLSLHSSTESIEESVRVSHSDSSGFFEPPAKPKSPAPASPQPTAPSPRPPYGHGSAPATVQSSPNVAAFGRPAKEAIPAPTVPEKTKVKEAAKERSGTTPLKTSTSTASTSTATETSAVPAAPATAIKEVKFTEGKAGTGKPYLNVWRKPISDIAKKFENKGK